MGSDNLFVYTACYASEAVAREDLATFQDVAAIGVVGKYDTALLQKTADGKIKVEKHGTQAASGGCKGAVAGGFVGLLFPPSILVGALAGALGGGLAGKLWGGMSRGDLSELGEVLDVGETGLVIVGESTLDEYVDKALQRAVKQARKVAKADLKALESDLHS